MLKIENLEIAIKKKQILKNINIDFQIGKNYCIVGQNGSGKTSLALSIMGHPSYKLLKGKISILLGGNSIEIHKLSPDQRSKLGVFLAFQHIPEIQGIKLFEFLRNIYNTAFEQKLGFLKFKELIVLLVESIGLNRELLWRDLNVGFSGGERRKIELLQIKLLKPKYIILDEIDSGLDVDSFKTIVNLILELNSKDNTFIFITHHFEILKNIDIDQVIMLENGQIKEIGDSKLIEKIKKNGFTNL